MPLGVGKILYKGLDTYKLTWPEWKCMFISAFPDHRDFLTILKKMINPRKRGDESW